MSLHHVVRCTVPVSWRRTCPCKSRDFNYTCLHTPTHLPLLEADGKIVNTPHSAIFVNSTNLHNAPPLRPVVSIYSITACVLSNHSLLVGPGHPRRHCIKQITYSTVTLRLCLRWHERYELSWPLWLQVGGAVPRLHKAVRGLHFRGR